MKTLIFSDTHLTPRFEEKKFKFLERAIKTVENVIINGDFWDGYFTSFDAFVDSSWKLLFPLLKSKKTVYVFGNHDKKEFVNQKVKLFSVVQTNQYTMSLGDRLFVAEHGNRLAPHLDDALGLKKLPTLVAKTAEVIQRFLVKKLGTSGIRTLFAPLNKKLKKTLASINTENHVYMLGHTHYGEVDLKHNFLNSGMIRYGFGQYLVLEHEKIRLKEEWYDH